MPRKSWDFFDHAMMWRATHAPRWPMEPGMNDNLLPRVVATPAALDLLAEIQARHGPVLFHQSGGCCDGSSPMCYPQGEFIIGDRDVMLGEIGGAPVYIGADQYEAWKHTQLIIDMVPGRGGMFSLDNGTERRFLTRSRAFAGGGACPLPN
jgi:uncharacterized protein (DUF779 family)